MTIDLLTQPVRIITNTKPIYIREEEDLRTLEEELHHRKLRHALVLDSNERLIGVVSTTDVMRYTTSALTGFGLNRNNAVLGGIQCKDLMVTEPITVAPDLSITEVAKIMKEKGIGCIPIVADKGTERESLIGIVTEREFTYLAAGHYT